MAPKYVPLTPGEGLDLQNGFMTKPKWRAAAEVILLWLNRIMLVISISCLIVAYNLRLGSYQWHLKQTAAFCMSLKLNKKASLRYVTNALEPAPLLSKIDLGEAVKRHEVNELFDRPINPYRGPPSDEVDALWESISDIGIFLISGEDVRRLGKDPSKTVKAPKHWGFGDDAHLAEIDSQHQLHCLNVLRKWAHYDYYFRSKYGDSPGLLQNAHRDHCLAVLLHTLTCQPSLDVITHNWVDTQPFPVPDFNLNRKCKNHQRIMQWQDRNQLTMDQLNEIAGMARPAEAFIFPLWPELVELNRLNRLNASS